MHQEWQKGKLANCFEPFLNVKSHLKSGFKMPCRCLAWLATLLQGQGWRSGESSRLPSICPGFDSRTRCHSWIEFVGSLLCSERFFPEFSGFPLSPKTNIRICSVGI